MPTMGFIGDLSGPTERTPLTNLPVFPSPLSFRHPSATNANTTINKITYATIDVCETPRRRQDIPMLLSVRVTDLTPPSPTTTPKFVAVCSANVVRTVHR